MTKADLISLYGEVWYEEQQRKNREAAYARYHANPEACQKTPEENKAAQERWLAKPGNREKNRERNRKFLAEKFAAMTDDERKAAYNAAYRRKRVKMASDPAYRAKEIEARKVQHLAWRDANRDHVNANSRKWGAANPEYKRTIAIVMSHQRRGAGPMDREHVAWIRTQPCIDCGSTERIEVGHMLPVKLGGTNDPANLIPQCRACNRRLSSKAHRLAESVGAPNG